MNECTYNKYSKLDLIMTEREKSIYDKIKSRTFTLKQFLNLTGLNQTYSLIVLGRLEAKGLAKYDNDRRLILGRDYDLAIQLINELENKIKCFRNSNLLKVNDEEDIDFF